MKFLALISTLLLCASAEIDLQNVQIPDMDDFAAIKDKCDRLGGNGTYNTLKESKEVLQSCLQGFVDFSKLKNEVEESKKTGSMDEVFGKYCAKRPKLSSCVQNFTTALRPCLSDEEEKALNTTLDILRQLGEFVCFRDGDRIAMFVAEGGVECIKSHTEGIKNCVNSTFKINPTVDTNSLPNLLMDKKKCDDLGKLQGCVVEELEKCKDSTPANIIDALFRFIKRSACKNKRSIYHSIYKRSVALTRTLYNPSELRKKIGRLIVQKCLQNSDQASADAFEAQLVTSQSCVQQKLKQKPILKTPVDEFKENIRNCTEELVDKTKACLPDEYKYWPEFQRDILLSIIDFTYRNKEKLNRPESRSEVMNCFQNFKQQSARDEMLKCFVHAETDDFSKAFVCSRYSEIKKCVSEQLEKRCIREITIKQLVDELFDVFIAPCNKS